MGLGPSNPNIEMNLTSPQTNVANTSSLPINSTVPALRPSKPFPQHVLCKDLAEAHHHAINERQEEVDGQ